MFMTYDTKAKIIEFLLIIISTTIMFVLTSYFQTKGLKTLVIFSICIPGITIGFYILFGKYVYLCGAVLTKQLRIWAGLSFLLITPMVLLVYHLKGRLG